MPAASRGCSERATCKKREGRTVYPIATVPVGRVSAERLPELNRRYRAAVEKSVHRVKDNGGEDRDTRGCVRYFV